MQLLKQEKQHITVTGDKEYENISWAAIRIIIITAFRKLQKEFLLCSCTKSIDFVSFWQAHQASHLITLITELLQYR